jgi:sodium-dependent dicarboxylate transporter 2/3/5
MSVKETFLPYASPIVFLFFGGFLIALALEKYNVHKRIAYGLIRLTGSKPRQVLLGFMAATASIAMWISNTATSVMMLPIGLSVVALLKDAGQDEKERGKFATLLMLIIAFSANIGGTMTLIGTPPNLVFAGFYSEYVGIDFPFIDWLVLGIPTGTLLLILAYFLLTKFIYPVSNEPVSGLSELLESKWTSLGKPDIPEKLVIAVFIVTVLGWVSLNEINQLAGCKLLSNTTVAMSGGLLMFLIPTNLKHGNFLLEWQDTVKLPWGIIILFGGGLTLASGLEKAGIIDLLASHITSAFNLSGFTLIIPLILLSIFLTEIMSNVALVTVLLPVIFGIAQHSGLDVLAITIPVTIAASCAFMMPISTPPNAIVYASGSVSVKQMARAGIWMNLISALVLFGLSAWIMA